MHLSAHTRFPVALLRPLGHPSISSRKANASARRRPAWPERKRSRHRAVRAPSRINPQGLRQFCRQSSQLTIRRGWSTDERCGDRSIERNRHANRSRDASDRARIPRQPEARRGTPRGCGHRRAARRSRGSHGLGKRRRPGQDSRRPVAPPVCRAFGDLLQRRRAQQDVPRGSDQARSFADPDQRRRRRCGGPRRTDRCTAAGPPFSPRRSHRLRRRDQDGDRCRSAQRSAAEGREQSHLRRRHPRRRRDRAVRDRGECLRQRRDAGRHCSTSTSTTT